jgi:riboflavin kinase/FMN adenylyltransferase
LRQVNKVKVFRDISEIKNFKDTVLTIGTFDGVHLGHQKIINRINEIKRNAGLETFIFIFDPHPRKVLFPEKRI